MIDRKEAHIKRIVVIADSHCGHRSGLTHPDFQYKEDTRDPVRLKYGEIQRVMYGWYVDTIQSLWPIDTLIVNGDAIDGKGERSGGTEQLDLDRGEQAKMAARVIEEAGAGKVYVILGTPYHGGRDEDHESSIGQWTKVDKCSNHEWVGSDGVIIDCRHKVSSSVIPHGRFTGPARAALWNILWAEREMQPKANIIVRSHVHYHVYAGTPDRLVMTTPALQAFTKFGSQECEGTNDIGIIQIDILGRGEYKWKAHLLDMRFAKAQVLPA